MSEDIQLNLQFAHKHFAAFCFNQTWQLIDKLDRSAEDDEQMLRLAHASLWHWTQRPDCTAKNLSIGLWLVSRVYSLLGEAENAVKYAQLCLAQTPPDDLFCLGYAYEALTRATFGPQQLEKHKSFLAEAFRIAELLPNDEKELLIKDLQGL